MKNLLLKILTCFVLLYTYGLSIAQDCEAEIQRTARLQCSNNPSACASTLASVRQYSATNTQDYQRQSVADLLLNEKAILVEIVSLQGNPAVMSSREVWLCLLRKVMASKQGAASSSAIDSRGAGTQSRAEQPKPIPVQNQATQQQSQQAQQQAQQTQQLAAQNQTRADQARQGQRRRHEPENEASHCIQPDFGGLYGGMKNTCDFKVWYTYCGYRPKENSWLTGMSCEKQSFGSDSVSPGRTSASHTKGVESIHWIACKEPAWTVDTEFVPGQGIKGRCHTVGGK